MNVVRHWRLQANRYSLKGTTCPTCGKTSVGSRTVCDCQAQPAGIYTFNKPTYHQESELAFEAVARR